VLILARRIGETVMIGENVSFTIVGINGNQVRVGIDAPTDVEVHREEVFRRIQSEKINELVGRLNRQLKEDA
jgi:carbon storage regulator